jgi:hypothetical protein
MKTEKLEKFHACNEAILYVKSQRNATLAWQNCPRGDWMLWIASRLKVDERLLTLTKGKCAETVLHLMKDQRSRDAVKSAIDYGNGIINKDQLKNAAAAAYVAYAAAAYAAADAAAAAAAYAAYAAADVAYAAAAAADDAAAYAAADAAAAATAKKQNQLQTADICRELLTDAVLKAWKKTTNNIKSK